MSDKTEPMMTNVKGYFNPNPYRVNVAISELGISVQLGPMEFILERGSNRKINDPILDKYVGFKMLSPELSNTPVPVIVIPRMPPPQPSMHVVGQGVRGPDGKWQLAPPAPPDALMPAPPNVTKPSVMAMSIEEARKRGFVGKAKLVDENYGAAETDGAPTRGDAIPRIKYAMESRAPLAAAQSTNLPQELVEQVQPGAVPLITGLQKAAQSDPEQVNLGRKAAEAAVQAQQGDAGVKQFRQEVKHVKAKAKVPSATIPPAAQPAPAPTIIARPGPAAPRRRVAQVVQPAAPPPALPAPQPMPVTAESPLVGGRPEGLPTPMVEEAAPNAAAPAPVAEAEPAPTAEDKQAGTGYVCGACGRPFQFRSYYIRHIQRAHKDRLQELMPH